MMSDRPESLAAALAEFQQHLPRIGKDTPGMVRDGKHIMYADLASVSAALLPLLGGLGLSFTARPTLATNDKFVLMYKLMHAPSGEFEIGAYPLPSSGTPQAIGSAITYARRYCLLAMTGAAPDEDDDDAQAAEQAARNQRNMPPEVDEHGAATVAEQTRMNRGHEPGAWRSTSTAENDGWYGMAADPSPEERPGTSTKSQRQDIYMALGRRGIKDHKAAIERLTGRDIAEPADMSYNEAIMVKARVDSWDGRTEELLSPFARVRVAADDGMAEDA